MAVEWYSVFSLATAIFCIIHILWSRRKLYQLSYKLPGPFALPLIGNAFIVACSNTKILNRITAVTRNYRKPMRLWLGPILFVMFNDPEHAEKITMSKRITHKHEVYSFLEPVLGKSLINSSGPQYRKLKRLIIPLFNTDFVIHSVKFFHEHFSVLTNVLEKQVDKGNFDVEKKVHSCFADIMSNIVLGMNLNNQMGENQEYIEATVKMYDVIYTRMLRPLLYPNFIFNSSKWKERMDKYSKILFGYIEKQISLATSGNGIIRKHDFSPMIDYLVKLAEEQPDVIRNSELKYHLLTLYAASEDTMTSIISFAILCFGMNPEYQQKAADEINEVFGDKLSEASFEDLSKLKYLDMCIKDVLRLFPIAPFIVRKCTEDFRIDDTVYSPGCALVVCIFNIHRNPEFWERPNDFYPDHFLPEKVEKRPPFAYLPFSAGPRACIGKVYGNAGMKLCISYILKNFIIEADGRVPDLSLRCDISVRSTDGYNVRLRRRF